MHDVASMSWGETVETAKAQSGLTNQEITRRFNAKTGLDMSPSNVQRWFSRHDEYWPSPPYIPILCDVLGNTLMSDWLYHQSHPQALAEAAGIADMLRLMPRLAKELGDVGAVLDEVLEDNKLEPDEARRVREELLDMQVLIDGTLVKLERVSRKAGRPLSFPAKAAG